MGWLDGATSFLGQATLDVLTLTDLNKGEKEILEGMEIASQHATHDASHDHHDHGVATNHNDQGTSHDHQGYFSVEVGESWRNG